MSPSTSNHDAVLALLSKEGPLSEAEVDQIVKHITGHETYATQLDKMRGAAIALRHYLTLAQPYVNPKHDFSRRVEKILEETGWIDP